MPRFLPLLLASALAAVCFSQTRFEMWPGAQYDAAVPTTQKVLGFAPGERIASPAEIVQYFEALASAAPTRLKLFGYARSYEKRRLVYAAIGSEANLRRLNEIKSGMQRLADPRKTDAAAARALTANLPAVIMLAYGVHGNEISGPDAAMMTAYHLLAARNDALVTAILRDTVILIDPAQNPDGRNRFVHNFHVAEGIEPDGSTVAAERNEPWPGGRTNHYNFDMNRDWFALTQPESRGRIKTLLEWFPLVFVDLHEMGTESTYFFAPGAAPFNPHITKPQLEMQEQFGVTNGRYFDQFGYPYFTREVYDEFYPGYGASWPWFYGGIGMTYENASVRGLLAERSDGTEYSYLASVQKHFLASLATCETAAKSRQKLLDNFYQFRLSALQEGQADAVREYLLPRRGDVSLVDKLALNLAAQGIEVRRSVAALTANGQSLPAGSYAISLAQPAKRLIRTLLEPKTEMDPQFLAEQERRRKRKLRDEIYDVTAWSLPLMFNVECLEANAATPGTWQAVDPQAAPKGSVTGGRATVAYLIPWGSTAAGRFLTGALRANLTVQSAGKAFTQNGRAFAPGTLIVPVKANAPSVHGTVTQLAAESGADAIAVNTSWVDQGTNFGSNSVVTLKRPRIALAWDTPTSASAAGHARYVIERQYGYPVTAIRTRQIAAADLSKFHVLVLPDAAGAYTAELAPALQRIKDWVSAGGTILALGPNATAYLASAGLIGLTQENAYRPDTPPAKPAAAPGPNADIRTPGKLLTKQEEYDKAIAADTELPDDVAGVIVQATVDGDHWLGAGAPATVHAVQSGRAIFAPIKTDRGVNVAVFRGPEQVLASGYLWEENRKQLAYKPLLVAARQGRGNVIAFTADPNYRAYVDGLNVLLLNALFRGPAYARGGAGAAAEEENQR